MANHACFIAATYWDPYAGLSGSTRWNVNTIDGEGSDHGRIIGESQQLDGPARLASPRQQVLSQILRIEARISSCRLLNIHTYMDMDMDIIVDPRCSARRGNQPSSGQPNERGPS